MPFVCYILSFNEIGNAQCLFCKLSLLGEENVLEIFKGKLLAREQIHAEDKRNNCVTL